MPTATSVAYKYIKISSFPTSTTSYHCSELTVMATLLRWLARVVLPIKSIPKLTVPSLLATPAASTEPAECAVCLSEIGGGEASSRELKCKHVFHRCCLERWMEHQGRTCPLCRDQLSSHEQKKSEAEAAAAAAAKLGRWRGEATIVFSPFSGFSSGENWWLR